MGKADTVTKAYMRRNDIFADAFNFYIYGGRQVIRPDQLTELDTTELASFVDAAGRSEMLQRYRDVLKSACVKYDERTFYVLLGIENQTEVHYAMPVRGMLYDALQYARQVDARASSNRKRGRRDAFLSGFRSEDTLIPVITLVILFNDSAWDGPRSIHEMLPDTPDEVLALVEDYRIHLIEPAAMTEEALESFGTSLKQVMGFIRYSRDKERLRSLVEEDEAFRSMDRCAADVINECTGLRMPLKKDEEVVDMCQAIAEMIEEATQESLEKVRAEGRIEGRAEGETEGTVKLAIRLVRNGRLTISEAAEYTGSSEAEIIRLVGKE